MKTPTPTLILNTRIIKKICIKQSIIQSICLRTTPLSGKFKSHYFLINIQFRGKNKKIFVWSGGEQ
jgi:hypothetical protein